MRAEPIRCPYCRQRHMPRHLCDPAKAVLDAMLQRGQSFDMPTVEFDQPMYDTMPGGRVLLQHLVVQAGAVEAAGVVHPLLAFTGRSPAGPLPVWVYPNTDEQLRAAAKLVHDMAELAIRTADAANGGTNG